MQEFISKSNRGKYGIEIISMKEIEWYFFLEKKAHKHTRFYNYKNLCYVSLNYKEKSGQQDSDEQIIGSLGDFVSWSKTKYDVNIRQSRSSTTSISLPRYYLPAGNNEVISINY